MLQSIELAYISLARGVAMLCLASTALGVAVPASVSAAATGTDAPRTALPSHGGPEEFTLQEAYAAAWARQPEARALALRRESAQVGLHAAHAWTAAGPAVELNARSDQLMKDRGAREYEAVVVLPLWLPGERKRASAVAQSEVQGVESRVESARLRLAVLVREAFWHWERAWQEQDQSADRLASAEALAADVAKRVKAGELARVDQNQALANIAAARGALVETQFALTQAALRMQALTGVMPRHAPDHPHDQPEALPQLPLNFETLDRTHPELADLSNQATLARRTAELSATRKRANAEVTLGTVRERGAIGEDYNQSLMLGVRVPFGGGSHHRARAVAANADALEAATLLELARARVLGELSAAQQRVQSTQTIKASASERARLAAETRGFVEKAFRAGEADLPTRLRVELEAVEASRQLVRAGIDHAAAISAWRQALGLLPE